MKPIRRPCFYKISEYSIPEARDLYNRQRSAAKRRKIPFLFTFSEWLIVWEMSGKFDERGKEKDQFVMARNGDTGPYSLENVEIISSWANNSQAHLGKRHSEELKAKRKRIARKIAKSRRKLTEEQIEKIRQEHVPGARGKGTKFGTQALSRKYDVSAHTIQNIIGRKLFTYKECM